jgi:hypothetical protein
MSRIKNYASALASGYLAIGANVAYTLASIPLALRYLEGSELALWGLTLQIAGYVALIDLGMGGVSRILIDYKDNKNDRSYGSVLLTSGLVSVVQGLLVFLAGGILALVLGPLVRIPVERLAEFRWLVLGQCGLLAANFLSRILTYLLMAHQRQDVLNYAQVASLAVSFAALWFCFESGWDVYSTLWAQLCGWVIATVIALICCLQFHLLPARGNWGTPSLAKFAEIFAFGRDIFLFVLGIQLIHSSQVILITRELGLNAALVWVVCTRPFTLASQSVYRIFETSCPALAEMIVRNERGHLLHRFRSLVVLSSSVAVLAGTLFAVGNQPFVRVWADSKATWSIANDIALAVWLVVSACSRCHVGLVGQTKDLKFLRYLYFFEGLWFVTWSLLLLKPFGIVAMITAGISGTLLFSFPYGIWRTVRYFNLSWSSVVWYWSWPTLRFGVLMSLVAFLVWWLTQTLGDYEKLIMCWILVAAVGIPAFFYAGIDANLRQEIQLRIARKLRK